MSEFKTMLESEQNTLGKWHSRTIQVRETTKMFIAQDGTRFNKATDESQIERGIVGVRKNDSLQFRQNIFLSLVDSEHTKKVMESVEKDVLLLSVERALQNKVLVGNNLTVEKAVRLKEVLVELGFME